MEFLQAILRFCGGTTALAYCDTSADLTTGYYLISFTRTRTATWRDLDKFAPPPPPPNH